MNGFRTYIETCELYHQVIKTIVDNRIPPQEFAEAFGKTVGSTLGGVLGGALGGGFGAVPGAMLGNWLGGMGDRWAGKGRTPELSPLYQQAQKSVDQLLDALHKTEPVLSRTNVARDHAVSKQHLANMASYLKQMSNTKSPEKMDQTMKSVESGQQPMRANAPVAKFAPQQMTDPVTKTASMGQFGSTIDAGATAPQAIPIKTPQAIPMGMQGGEYMKPKKKGFFGWLKDKWHGADKWTEKNPMLTQAAALAGGMGAGALANYALSSGHSGRSPSDSPEAESGGVENWRSMGDDVKSNSPSDIGDPSGGADFGGGAGDPLSGSTHVGDGWRSEVGDSEIHKMSDGSRIYKTKDGTGGVFRNYRNKTGIELWQKWIGDGWSKGHTHPKLIK